MKLPDRAIIDDQKLTGYLLNPLHRDGKKHAELFKRLLDVDLTKADVLRRALLDAALNSDARSGRSSAYGQKFEIRFSMTGPRGTYTLLSVWMIRLAENEPRLLTAYIV